jgi:hypothetical protein
MRRTPALVASIQHPSRFVLRGATHEPSPPQRDRLTFFLLLDEPNDRTPFEHGAAANMKEMRPFSEHSARYHGSDSLLRPWGNGGKFPN